MSGSDANVIECHGIGQVCFLSQLNEELALSFPSLALSRDLRSLLLGNANPRHPKKVETFYSTVRVARGRLHTVSIFLLKNKLRECMYTYTSLSEGQRYSRSGLLSTHKYSLTFLCQSLVMCQQHVFSCSHCHTHNNNNARLQRQPSGMATSL